MTTKPLFIPLKREFFEAFASGKKTIEYRKLGPRWNEKTCRPGRAVVLSLGYGKARRLRGVVTWIEVIPAPTNNTVWRACYGDEGGLAISIGISLHP